MPNSSSGRRRVTWSSKADPDGRVRERWHRADCRTDWAQCGREWDVVAVELGRGLDALDALRLGLHRGYPVLADYLTNRLYVMVEPGTGHVCRDLPGVRVLSTGAQVLVPVSGAGSAAAHWVSPPRASRLVDSGKLATALLRMVAVGAVAS
ncbi:hypothetical protein OG806_49510 [Streptomyces sp. NBC_00882]|uniref:hypothetical protein n=1 Tax=Streptomyces sp. NBC_00882 TaxID=2975856 RepID=UPI00386FACFF|nr:hypothetical protein OG806_00440 [Streptomyces sp. NBC_00882]WSZ36855.1 hypothetical protein OG806_49510 [Streptomyces sp. NBC_00882]